MPFYFNGTLIPENVANAFSFNGTDVTKVVYNGTAVWEQQLFSATWTNSIVVYAGILTIGLDVSGSAYRASATYSLGNWLYATPSGLANGTSTAVYDYDFFGAKTQTVKFITTTTSIKWDLPYIYTTVNFSPASGFTGSAVNPDGVGLTTSGGALRLENNISGTMYYSEFTSLI